MAGQQTGSQLPADQQPAVKVEKPEVKEKDDNNEFFNSITRELNFNRKGFEKVSKRPIEVMPLPVAKKVVDKISQRNELDIFYFSKKCTHCSVFTIGSAYCFSRRSKQAST